VRTPIHNRIGASSTRCSCKAQATASPARANAATKLSPSPCFDGPYPRHGRRLPRTPCDRAAPPAAAISSGWPPTAAWEPSTSARSASHAFGVNAGAGRSGGESADVGGRVTLTDLRLGAITVHFEAEGETVKTLGVPDDWQLLTPAK
jgi:hypothetical protein